MNSEYIFSVASIVYLIVALISYLFILSLLFFILRRLIRALKNNITVFSDNRNARLVGLGIAVLAFPGVVPAVFLAFIRGFYTLLAVAPVRLYTAWAINIEPCLMNSDLDTCVRTLTGSYLQEWNDILEPIGLQFVRLPYKDIVLFIVLWALAAVVVNFLVNGEGDPKQESRFHNLFENAIGRIGKTTISNVSLALVLFLAIYLSIAAIIAIPIMQEQTQTFQEVSEDNLRIQLEGELGRFDAKYTDEVGLPNPLQEIQTVLAGNADTANGDEPGAPITETTTVTTTMILSVTEPFEPVAQLDIPEDVYRQLNIIVSDMDSSRAGLKTDWQTLNAAVNGQLFSAKERALTSYRVNNLDRLGSDENFAHFLQITNWFSQQVTAGDAVLNQCRGFIEGYENALQSWSLTAAATLQNQSDFIYIISSAPRFSSTINCDASQFTIDSEPPQRQAFGSSLGGPFGPVASWLLETESLPLAIVTGMLGFGLLGAAFASFVRDPAPRQPGDPLVKEFLSDFLIPGFSATIIVFLAVKGGLVVFSGPDAEPNPYILFFVCTVAAVFNKDIWNWAEETLKNMFNSNPPPEPKPLGKAGDGEAGAEGAGEEKPTAEAAQAAITEEEGAGEAIASEEAIDPTSAEDNVEANPNQTGGELRDE